jgi:ferric enterobactin receptor
MKICTCLLSLIFLCVQGRSQDEKKVSNPGGIKGIVTDSSSKATIAYATVTIFLNSNKKPAAGTSTDSTGYFYINNISLGNYTVVIEFIGYRTKTYQNIILGAKVPTVNLGNIHLASNTKVLADVTVTGQKPVVENKIDKLVYNTENDITSQTGVATDILKKVPQISVDVDGNIELQGSSNIRFLINGKPSTIFGSNVTDVLQSIPANQIKSIEVITNPGAKYDAQGTGGIINIILKHNTLQGMNGTLSLTAGTIVQNGSLNVNVRKGKFGLNVFMNGNARLTTTTSNSFQRVSTDTTAKSNFLLQQDGSTDFSRHGFQSGIGFDWALSDRNNFSGALNYHNFGNKSIGLIHQMEQTHDDSGGVFPSSNSTINTNNAFKQYSFDPSLNFTHIFRNKEQQIEIGADGSFAHNLINSGSDQYQQPQDSLIYGTRNNNPARENEYEIMADYVQPLSKDINFGIGGKFSGYDISSTANALLWNPYANTYLYDSSLSNDLSYHQKVYAAYAELNFPVGSLFEARLGGRYERTQVNSFYSNAQQKIEEGYNTFIPSIFLMKNMGENQTLKLSYTKRINRPDYADLNPYINASDPNNVITGNPNLKPEIWDRFEASYNKDLGRTGSYMITLFYRISNNDIQPFIVYYPSLTIGGTTYTNVAVTTRENIGIEKNAGTNLFFNFHINEKFNVRSNFMFFYRYTINHVDTGYNSSGTIYRFNINASYQITGNLAAEFFGNYSSPHNEAQGTYPSFISYSVALRKQFWNKKGSIALTGNNIFAKYVDQRTELYGPGFVSNGLRKFPYRSIGINFTWKFGKMESKKEKSEDNNIDLNGPQL